MHVLGRCAAFSIRLCNKLPVETILYVPDRSGDKMKKLKITSKKRTLLIVAAIVILLIMMFYMIRIFSLINKINYATDEEEVPVIDSSYAASQGIIFPRDEMIHDPKIINILFLGTDYTINNEERGRADSNMLCSFNTRNGQIKLISFERGIGVPVPGRGSDLLTHAYHWGGPMLSQSIISSMFNIDIKAYVQVDFQSFAEIVDAIGGIDIELTELEAKALSGAIPTQVWAWGDVHEGWNHLGGHDTLQYCRLRSIDSDWNRQRRQRTVLEQLQKKCRGMSAGALIRLAEEVMPMIHTNLTKDHVSKLVLNLPRLLRGSVSQLQVPDKNSQSGYIRCVPEYESRKISNFLYDSGFELSSPY